jgi:hypothetical protein
MLCKGNGAPTTFTEMYPADKLAEYNFPGRGVLFAPGSIATMLIGTSVLVSGTVFQRSSTVVMSLGSRGIVAFDLSFELAFKVLLREFVARAPWR